ncbi:hypothetical protein GPALN_003514 [Globodera pallida]|nr:hypothetical protein GPALN_003514 [Globodera pallida]
MDGSQAKSELTQDGELMIDGGGDAQQKLGQKKGVDGLTGEKREKRCGRGKGSQKLQRWAGEDDFGIGINDAHADIHSLVLTSLIRPPSSICICMKLMIYDL